MKVTIFLLNLFTLFVYPQTKDISGTWIAKRETPGGEMELVYELKLVNDKAERCLPYPVSRLRRSPRLTCQAATRRPRTPCDEPDLEHAAFRPRHHLPALVRNRLRRHRRVEQAGQDVAAVETHGDHLSRGLRFFLIHVARSASLKPARSSLLSITSPPALVAASSFCWKSVDSEESSLFSSRSFD